MAVFFLAEPAAERKQQPPGENDVITLGSVFYNFGRWL